MKMTKMHRATATKALLCLVLGWLVVLAAARPSAAQQILGVETNSLPTSSGHRIKIWVTALGRPYPFIVSTWDTTVSRPSTGFSQTVRMTSAGSFAPDVLLPQAGGEYNVFIQNVDNPSITYSCSVLSIPGSYAVAASSGRYATSSVPSAPPFIGVAVGSSVVAPGTNTLAVRVHGTTQIVGTHTLSGASPWGNYEFKIDSNITANTTYDWCIVSGATVNPSDPAVQAAFTANQVIVPPLP